MYASIYYKDYTEDLWDPYFCMCAERYKDCPVCKFLQALFFKVKLNTSQSVPGSLYMKITVNSTMETFDNRV